MNEDGFITLSRGYFRHWLWEERREYSRAEAWLDMIRMATFRDETACVQGRCLSLQPGDLVASIRYLAARWGWSKSKVERFQESLLKERMIETRTETGLMVIRLCNYRVYNRCRDGDRDAGDDTPETVAGHARDKSNNVNNPKNINTNGAHERLDGWLGPLQKKLGEPWQKQPQNWDAIEISSLMSLAQTRREFEAEVDVVMRFQTYDHGPNGPRLYESVGSLLASWGRAVDRARAWTAKQNGSPSQKLAPHYLVNACNEIKAARAFRPNDMESLDREIAAVRAGGGSLEQFVSRLKAIGVPDADIAVVKARWT